MKAQVEENFQIIKKIPTINQPKEKAKITVKYSIKELFSKNN